MGKQNCRAGHKNGAVSPIRMRHEMGPLDPANGNYQMVELVTCEACPFSCEVSEEKLWRGHECDADNKKKAKRAKKAAKKREAKAKEEEAKKQEAEDAASEKLNKRGKRGMSRY